MKSFPFPPLIVLGVGLCFATLPYWWTQDFMWIGDQDELAFYAPMGAEAYREHPWRLNDPTTGGPTYYQPLSTLPGLVVAKAFGVGSWRVGFCWRVVGGLMLAGGWYLLLRTHFRPYLAALGACLLLTDPGVLNGQLGYVTAKSLLDVEPLTEFTGTVTAASLPQWRILNPVQSWPLWLGYLALTARAVRLPTRWRVAAAGVALGLLFHSYFYTWTTAVLGLVLAGVVDRGRWRVYLGILGVGGLIGLPAILSSAAFRSEYGNDWLLRTDKFLPVSHFAELLLPKMSFLILAGGWVWVWRRSPEWKWLASIATAALILMNHTLVTGLQIENFHWNYALGPPLSFLLVLIASDAFRNFPRAGRTAAILLTISTLLMSGWRYARAVSEVPEVARIQDMLTAFREHMTAAPPPAGGSVAGDESFQYCAAIETDLRPLAGYTAVLSPISDDELATRVALNSHLLGMSRDEFRNDQSASLASTKWGGESRSGEQRAIRFAARLAAWDRMIVDPDAAISAFDVRVIARPAGRYTKPLPSGWSLRHQGDRWSVWVRSP